MESSPKQSETCNLQGNIVERDISTSSEIKESEDKQSTPEEPVQLNIPRDMPPRNNKRKKNKNSQAGESSKRLTQPTPTANGETVPNINLASTSSSSINNTITNTVNHNENPPSGKKIKKKGLPKWAPSANKLYAGAEADNINKANEEMEEKIDKENFEEELKCTICSEIFINAVTLNCSHSFCQFCILKWRKEHTTCPICRQTISHQNSTLALDKCVEHLLQNANEDTKNHRKTLIEYREKNKETNPPATANSNTNSNGNNYDNDYYDDDDEEGDDFFYESYDEDDDDDLEYDEYDDFFDNDGHFFDGEAGYDDYDEEEDEYYDLDEENGDYEEEAEGESESYDDEEDEDDDDYDSYDSESSSGDEPQGTCYNCGQEGHMARSCPTKVQYNGIPGAYYGGYGSCFKCNNSGHWANGCPN